MKISELAASHVTGFLRLPEEEAEISPDALLEAAKSYVAGYTGMTPEQMDEHDDLTIAVLVLCAELYENRLMSAESAAANRTVQTILGMYRRNLI